MIFRPLVSLLAYIFCTIVHAEGLPSRTWDFDLRTPGTYKIQVEHAVNTDNPGKRITCSIQIGRETQSRELDLIVGYSYIPLIADIPSPQKVRVVIAGLSQPALRGTRVYVFNANSQPPDQYFDPSKTVELKAANRLRAILQQPDDQIDLALVKVTIDKMIDPTVKVESILQKIDAMV